MLRYLFSNLILAPETPQQNIGGKAKGQDSENITTLLFHMHTQRVIVTVFKRQPKQASYLHTELSTFEFE